MTRDLGELLEMRFKAKRRFMGPITSSSITMIYGQAGTGKSYLAEAIMLHAARERGLLNWHCEQRARCLGVDGEMGTQAIQSRVRAMLGNDGSILCDSVHHFGYDDCDLKVIWNISLPLHQARYTEMFKPFDIIVIDNLSTCSYPMNERDGEIAQWIRTQPWLVGLRDAGKAIILVHHTNKQGLQLGSSMKEFVADTVIKLKKVEHESTNLVFDLTYDKHRNMRAAEAMPIRVTAIESDEGWMWTYDPLATIANRSIQDMLASGMKPVDVSRSTGMPLYEVLAKAKAANSEEENDLF